MLELARREYMRARMELDFYAVVPGTKEADPEGFKRAKERYHEAVKRYERVVKSITMQ